MSWEVSCFSALTIIIILILCFCCFSLIHDDTKPFFCRRATKSKRASFCFSHGFEMTARAHEHVIITHGDAARPKHQTAAIWTDSVGSANNSTPRLKSRANSLLSGHALCRRVLLVDGVCLEKKHTKMFTKLEEKSIFSGCLSTR